MGAKIGKNIHIWKVNAKSYCKFVKKFNGILTPDEKQKADSFYKKAHRDFFIIRKGILRFLLSEYLDKKPSEIYFKYGRCGKPFIKNSNISFNYSYSQNILVYAFAINRKIGIDIEQLRHLDYMDIVKEFFSDSEQKAILESSYPKRQSLFFNLWVCKEACLKAEGTGLKNMKKIGIHLASNPSLGALKSRENKKYHLYRMTFRNNNSRFIAALAIAGADISDIKNNISIRKYELKHIKFR